MTMEDRLKIVFAEMLAEALKAASKWPEYNSAHEALGILLEEVSEVQAHVFTNQSKRNLNEMRKELIQVGAVTARFTVDIVDGGRGHA